MPDPALPNLVLHDTRTRTRTVFTPIDPAHVRLYMCGPTVYDVAHIGNMRAFLVADLLVRVLRRLHPRVTYVRNITDVEDKIAARAAERGITIGELTERTIADLHADLLALGAAPPDIEPRVTGHIPEIVDFTARLLALGQAYVSDGHVLFSVPDFPPYGQLSGRTQEDLRAGARVEIADYKRDPADFVLWKPSTPEQPGWDSPWGRGRPGWHIECSAMCHRHLGENFDLHCGGEDLIFPHHENERAQSLAAYRGSSFAKTWVHNAMLQVDGHKMSKSAGNFVTIRQALDRAPGEAIRLALLHAHHRSVLNFTWDGLADAKRELDRFYRALAKTPPDTATRSEPPRDAGVLATLCDDLNTPEAIAILHREADAALAGDADAAARLRDGAALLGLLQADPQSWFQGDPDRAGDALRIEAMIAERLDARRRRDFAAADAIRAELAATGILLEDHAGGTDWKRA